MNQADTPSTCPITESATEPVSLDQEFVIGLLSGIT
jgi:hypothetical protein